MFYEYALEPAVLSSWDRTRYFLDAFGLWKGRLLAEYPRRWRKMVFEGLSCPDVEKKKIIERMAQLDKAVFSPRADAQYDGARSWFENAEGEHKRLAFRAIVATKSAANPCVLDASLVHDTSELWRVESGQLMPRTPESFVQALRLLLVASSRVLVIDPYFDADKSDKTRPLVAFCTAVSGKAVVEVHFSEKKISCAHSMLVASQKLPRLLPPGMKVTLQCWNELAGGPRLHNRYIVTDVGGVKFGDSIEVGEAGQEDHVSILDEPSRAALWNQYLGATPAFKSAGLPQVFIGGAKRAGRP